MTGAKAPRLRLTGGSNGPHGWELDTGPGSPRSVTLDELAARQQQLRTDGEAEAADNLERQTVRLMQVAEHWRLRCRIRVAAMSDPPVPERVRVVEEHPA